MWTPSYLLGPPILTSTNVVSIVATIGPFTSVLFLLSTNQTSNPLVVTQPMTIQVGIASIPRRNNPSLGPNSLNLGENPIMGSHPTMGPNPITPTMG